MKKEIILFFIIMGTLFGVACSSGIIGANANDGPVAVQPVQEVVGSEDDQAGLAVSNSQDSAVGEMESYSAGSENMMDSSTQEMDPNMMGSGGNMMAPENSMMDQPVAGNVTAPVDTLRAADLDLSHLSFESGEHEAAVMLIADEPGVANWLDEHPQWQYSAYDEAEGQYYVDFYLGDWDEWLGYGIADVNTGEIIEKYFPLPLDPALFQIGLDRTRQLVMNDAEVLARLGNPDDWEITIDFNRWDQTWETYFWNGIDQLTVVVYDHGDYMEISDIFDPDVLSAAEEREAERNEAISLAYNAEGFDDALANVDDWTTYVNQEQDTVWTVAFVGGGQDLFYAVVDIDAGTVLESGTAD